MKMFCFVVLMMMLYMLFMVSVNVEELVYICVFVDDDYGSYYVVVFNVVFVVIFEYGDVVLIFYFYFMS